MFRRSFQLLRYLRFKYRNISNLNIAILKNGILTCVAEVDELLGQQVGEQLHDEQQVLVLVLLGGGVAPLAALVVLGVDLQQRQARLVQLHGLGLAGGGGRGENRESAFLETWPSSLKGAGTRGGWTHLSQVADLLVRHLHEDLDDEVDGLRRVAVHLGDQKKKTNGEPTISGSASFLIPSPIRSPTPTGSLDLDSVITGLI